MDEARPAWDALADGNLGEADTVAKALLAKEADKGPFHSSDDQHSVHLSIGHVCLRRGDVDAAERHLLTAARIDDRARALCTEHVARSGSGRGACRLCCDDTDQGTLANES